MTDHTPNLEQTDDVRANARRLLHGITSGPWAWMKYGDQYEVFTEDKTVEPGDVADNLQHLADAEFIAAAPALVQGLLEAVDQEQDRALHLAIRATGCAKAEAERDAALAVIAQVREYCEAQVTAPGDGIADHVDPAHILRIFAGGVS